MQGPCAIPSLGRGREGFHKATKKMVKIIPYNPNLKQLARKLRKDMTHGEVLLWNELKDHYYC
jgi:hypothetical protein